MLTSNTANINDADLFVSTMWGGHCSFCELLAGESQTPFRSMFSEDEAPSEILYETENLVVVADIGLMVEGFFLILHKRHIPSFAYSYQHEMNELFDLKQKLKQAISREYGNVIAFEHGAASFSHNAGCCIEHAHLHLVPSAVDIMKYLQRDYSYNSISDIRLLSEVAKEHEYLLYENGLGNMYIAKGHTVPSQYFRRILGLSLGGKVPWNWRDYIRFADELRTKEIIRNTRSRITASLQSIINEVKNI